MKVAPPNESAQEKFNRLCRLHKAFSTLCKRVRHCKAAATTNIRKVRMGKDDWLPKYAKLQRTIDLWRRVKKLKSGGKTSRWEIKHSCRQLGLRWETVKATSFETALENLKTAYKELYDNKDNFSGWRWEHCTSLREAIAKEKEVDIKVIDDRFKREAKSKEEGLLSQRVT